MLWQLNGKFQKFISSDNLSWNIFLWLMSRVGPRHVKFGNWTCPITVTSCILTSICPNCTILKYWLTIYKHGFYEIWIHFANTFFPLGPMYISVNTKALKNISISRTCQYNNKKENWQFYNDWQHKDFREANLSSKSLEIIKDTLYSMCLPE